MGIRFQVVFDCSDPDRLARFWAEALRYQLREPPEGFDTWTDYWRSIGVPDDELDESVGYDSIVDPDGVGPNMWFQRVPEGKVVKNRLHLDLDVSEGRSVPLATREDQVTAERKRLTALGASVVRVLDTAGIDHYAVVMADPEGNEFCIR